MFKLTLATLLLFTAPAFAEQSEGNKKPVLAFVKDKVANNIDKRIASLTTFKSCVQAAGDRTAVKSCRSTHRDAMKAMGPKGRRN